MRTGFRQPYCQAVCAHPPAMSEWQDGVWHDAEHSHVARAYLFLDFDWTTVRGARPRARCWLVWLATSMDDVYSSAYIALTFEASDCDCSPVSAESNTWGNGKRSLQRGSMPPGKATRTSLPTSSIACLPPGAPTHMMRYVTAKANNLAIMSRTI